MRRGVVASEIMVRITKPGALLSLTLTAVGIFMMRRGAVVFFLGGEARYAPSYKFQKQQKYWSKLVNLFFPHY